MSKPNAKLLLEQHARQVRQPIAYTHGAEETPESTPIQGQLSTLSVSKAAIPLAATSRRPAASRPFQPFR
jgi:hypothetical protein